jgi:hypothetical protein
MPVHVVRTLIQQEQSLWQRPVADYPSDTL